MKKWIFLFTILSTACAKKDEVVPKKPVANNTTEIVMLSSSLDGNADSGNKVPNGVVSGATPTNDRNEEADRALYFNGVDNYVDFGSSISTDSVSTIAIWAKFDTLGNAMPSMELVSKSSYRQGMELVLYNGKLSFYLVGESDNNNVGISISKLKTNKWYHIVAVYDRQAEEMKLYMDGILKSSERAPLDVTKIDRLMLGNWDYTEESRFFKGALDDLIIYNKPLNDEEILSLYEKRVE